jgi:hypothetical protein
MLNLLDIRAFSEIGQRVLFGLLYPIWALPISLVEDAYHATR